MKNKISVIVPIYNVEVYLEECIESLLQQTILNQLEIILVDDGSGDGCGAICDRYENECPQVKVVHKENGGLVSARKAGLTVASGDFVGYVDGDDWVEPDYYEKLLEQMCAPGAEASVTNSDIVCAGFTLDQAGQLKKVGNIIPNGLYTEKADGEDTADFKNQLLYCGQFFETGIIRAVWNKLFCREKLLDIQNRVPDCIKMGEDVAVTFPYLFAANTIVVDNSNTGYHYRVVEESMSRKFDRDYFERAAVLYEHLQKENIKALQLEYYHVYLLMLGLDLLYADQAGLSDSEREKLLKEVMHSQDESLQHFIKGADLGLLQLPATVARRTGYLKKGNAKAITIDMNLGKLRMKLKG